MKKYQSSKLPIVRADYLIIGSGLAGLYTAFLLKDHGKVVLVTKGSLQDSNSYLAQGGIAAVLSENDSLKEHYEDTLKAGNYLNNPYNTNLLVKQGRDEVLELIKLGVMFDRNPDTGELHFTREGAHSKNRVIHALGDSTGQVVCDSLINILKSHPNVHLHQYSQALALLTNDKSCQGAMIWQKADNKLVAFAAPKTVLATGGLTGIYATSTANPTILGDGYILAKRAGVSLKNLQFIQFHPTALATADENCFLISEALRGEGATLKNCNRQPFMKKYHNLQELAPRHVVSQAIWNEISMSGVGHVYLDTTHLNSHKLAVRFPKIFATCKERGYLLGRDLIPVKPAAHYSIGGVVTNSSGETSVSNLFAVGEVAYTGVHGSNRLASNSLLECLAFGRRAAQKIRLAPVSASDHGNLEQVEIMALETIQQLSLNDSTYSNFEKAPSYIAQLALVKNIIYRNLGITRVGENLQATKKELAVLLQAAKNQKSNLIGQLQLTSVIELSLELTNQALSYPSNTGCHYLMAKKNAKGELCYAENS